MSATPSRRARIIAGMILVLATASTGPAASAAWTTSTSIGVASTVEPIRGSIAVSPSVASVQLAAASGSSSTAQITVQNTSIATSWTGYRIGVAPVGTVPGYAKVAFKSDGSCYADANNGTVVTETRTGTVSTAVAPGGSLGLCFTVTHTRPAEETVDVTFAINVTVSGTVRQWSTGPRIVSFIVTIPGSAPVAHAEEAAPVARAEEAEEAEEAEQAEEAEEEVMQDAPQ